MILNCYNNIGMIDLSTLKNNRKLSDSIILPAIESTQSELADEHSAEPIKSLNDIYAITNHLKSNRRYRDNMLFIIGINFGLRVSDLRMLRFSDLITSDFMFKESFPVYEIKTRNTRKKKKNRHITINNAVIEAVTLYLENTPGVCLSDYLFKSESNRGSNVNQPLSIKSIDRILKGVAGELSISSRVSTHTLRKTFCYHQMVMAGNDNRRLLLLQKMLNHSSPAQTLDYIGITSEEIDEAYKQLNLGGTNVYSCLDSRIYEIDSAAV